MSGDGTASRVFACSLVIASVLLGYALTGPSYALAACGDGVVESPLEECDDGNIDAGDCCAADCLFEPLDSLCGLDDLCLRAGAAKCDGQGVCALPNYMFCFGSTKADLSDPGEPDARRLKANGKYAQETDTIGDPRAGTQYELCVYNYHAVGPLTVDYRLMLPVGAGWEASANGFTYRRPKGATIPVQRVRLTTRLRADEFLGEYYVNGMKVVARGAGLALPGPVDPSRYFDVDAGISSVCLVNDLGFMVGVSTWGSSSINESFVNEPDRVRWVPPRLPD